MPRQPLPIVYVRGYAGTQGEVEETVDDPFYGFSRGSTHIRVNARQEPQFFAFESPLVRLMKDHGYRDAYYGNAQQVPPPHDERLWPQTIWIYRYYDPTSETFTWKGVRLSIESAARDLRTFITGSVLPSTRAKKVWLVAHSMGGLVARCLIQKIAPEEHNEQAHDYIDKLFTYGTPHGGIHFGVPGGGVMEWVRDKIGWNNADDFGRDRMFEYLTAGVRPKPRAKVKAPASFDERTLPPERFPLDRVFCLVGTNAKDYDVALGLSRKTVGPQSDGLVQIGSAYIRGAHRAYVHRSHSGRYGMVNSEEGYQNLRRFLFGDLKVTAILKNARIPSPADVFYQADIRVSIRALPVAMHERTMDHYCPLQLSTPVVLADDDAAPRWVENRHQAAGTHHLFTTFLIPKEADVADRARRWAVRISVYKMSRDGRGNILFDKHLEHIPFWSDALIMDITPPAESGRGYVVDYVWASAQTDPTPLALRRTDAHVTAEIPLPQTAEERLGVRPVIALEAAAWD